MFAPRNIALHAELLKEAEEKVAALTPLTGGLIGAGSVLGAGIPAALLAKHLAEKDKKRARDTAFGAGMATGVATPLVIKKLLHIANERGLVPPDALGNA